MSFKFESPIKLPRWTSEEFAEMKRKYQAKYGSSIHIPGFEDIVKWDVTPEPSAKELAAYRAKDVEYLGDRRYEEIRALMAKKKQNFLRLLASPTPEIVVNASSILTTLDDVNDALGTFAVAIRILARKLPSMFSKFLTGPAGWMLTGAELAGAIQQITCLPFKARNIQHELNEYVKHHPLSKKAKLRRLKKLARVRLTKGEIIEGLQTTENMFGVGLTLGGIMGLLWDIPAGLYRHVKGEKVTITGLPEPLLWFDKVTSNLLKRAASLWTGLPAEFDQDLTKSMVAVNFSSVVSRVVFPYFDWQSVAHDIHNILFPAPVPEYPSTRQVVEDELGDPSSNTGWPFSNDQWISATHTFNTGLATVQESLAAWRERNKTGMESMIGSQNQVDAGLHILGALETDDDLELEYDPHTHVMLKLLNQGYRYPCPTDPEQVESFEQDVVDHWKVYGELHYRDALLIARDLNCFEFTTRMPTGYEKPIDLDAMEIADIRKDEGLMRLRYLTTHTLILPDPISYITSRSATQLAIRFTSCIAWFKIHGWPMGYPTAELCLRIRNTFVNIFSVLKIDITKTRCCSIHSIPLFTMDLLPPLLLPPPFTALPATADPAYQFGVLLRLIDAFQKTLSKLTSRQIVLYLNAIYPILQVFIDQKWDAGQRLSNLCHPMEDVINLAFDRLGMARTEILPFIRCTLPVYSQIFTPAHTWWSP